jgi:hypothetical protein
MKCQLKPLVRTEYGSTAFADTEWAALQTAFPNGVCDWSKLGVEQQPTVAWQSYKEGPGGVGLGDPPQSVPANDVEPVVPEAPVAVMLPLLVGAVLLLGLRLRSPSSPARRAPTR